MKRNADLHQRARGVSLRFACLFMLVFGGMATLSAQAQLNYSDLQADQLFRQGVTRFHDGNHSEAVVILQRVLSLQPQNQLARAWLGRAYFYAGFETAAIQEWETVSGAGAGSPTLTAFLETIQARRGLSRDVKEDFNFFPVHELTAADSRPYQFRRPAAVICMSDGSSYISSFGNNALVQIDANGRTMHEWRGGFTHFSGPFGMCLVQGKRLFITQMASDQVFEVSMQGQVVKTFGSKGSGPGQLMGPQFIAWNKAGILFVSDFGNRRINKFDLDGNFIAAFGERSSFFAGLERPTGLIWQDDKLYVGDASRKNPAIHIFDADGNPQGDFSDVRLADLEDLSAFGDGRILVTTRASLFTFDPVTQILDPLFTEEKNTRVRWTSAGMDFNGNVVATDFDTEKVTWFSRLAGIYAGLHVQINRVVADKFPEIYVEVSVLDNLGNPVVGLQQGNFTVTEGRKALSDAKLVASGYLENNFDGVLLVQSDAAMTSDFNKEALANAVGGIADNLGAGANLALVSAGSTATVEAPMGSTKQLLQASLQNMPRNPFWYLDLGIRTAVPQLLKKPGLRHIFFVGQGSLAEDAFARYGLEENLNFLRNNRIRFTVIQTEDIPLDPALAYLVKETGGMVYQLYNPKGLTNLSADLITRKDGSYLLRYRSLFDSDFGRKYLPVEVGARLFQKSGRDESGYFAPLKL